MGILANSASSTQTSSSADASVSGYVTGERIVLTTNPTGTDYVWALGGPSNTNLARSALSAETGASVSFTPDVSGTYLITCNVDVSTAYVLRVSVEATAISQLVEAIRHSPKTDASIPAPSLGSTQFWSYGHDTMCLKMPDSLVVAWLLGSIGDALTDADASVTITAGNVRVLPASTLSANRTLTLSTTDAVVGDTIIVQRLDSNAYTYAIANGGAGAGTLLTFASATKGTAVCVFDGTNWALEKRLRIS